MGWVYVVESDGYYKIGRTQDLTRRILTLKIQLPAPIKVVCTIPVDDDAFLEQFLHYQYSDYRTNGEWFALERPSIFFLHHLAGEMRRLGGQGYVNEWDRFWNDLPESMNGTGIFKNIVQEFQEV